MQSPLYIGFSSTLPKSGIFQWTPKISIFSSLSPSYLLKVTKLLVEICQFEFSFMREKNIFAHKIFFPLNISDFDLLLCEYSNPSRIKSPPLFQQFPFKSWGPVKLPLRFWKIGWRFNPVPSRKEWVHTMIV